MPDSPRRLSFGFSVPMSMALNSNKLNNTHHHTRAPITAELLEMGKLHMRNVLGAHRGHNPPPYMERALVTVTVAWHDRTRRDSHNFMPMMKPLIDGFVKAGLIEDDRDRHLIGPHIIPADKLYKAPYGKHAWLQWEITEIPPQPKF